MDETALQVVLETAFLDTFFSQCARLFTMGTVQRLRLELDVGQLDVSPVHGLILFLDQILGSCCKLIKE